jgi:hypothetical protein
MRIRSRSNTLGQGDQILETAIGLARRPDTLGRLNDLLDIFSPLGMLVAGYTVT